MIFHIDLDAFFAAIEQRDNPQLKGKPVIIGNKSSRGVVSTASYEARAFGVHSGMPIFQAQRLCPQGIFIPGNFYKYHEASACFYTVLRSFTPYVEESSIDEAYASFFGCEQYYGDMKVLANKIKSEVERRVGITCSIGIAQYKEIAKIASGFQKPNGLVYVEKESEKEFLSVLPIREIPGLGPETEKILKTYHIKHIDQIANLSLSFLTQRLGKHGMYLWNIANGRGSSNLILDWIQKSVGRETTFAIDSSNTHFLKSTLLYLTHKTAFDLRSKHLKGKCVSLKLRSSSFATTNHQTMLSTETDTAGIIFEQASELFDRVWNRESLRLLGVSVSHMEHDHRQLGLFEGEQKRRENIEEALDTIRNKYGFFASYPLSLHYFKQTTLH